MAQNIIKQLDFGKDELAKKSKIILDKILNNYATFDIITIDSLFHRIIRGFAKELKLSYNFDVEIENEIVLNESADYFIKQVGKDKQISNLLEIINIIGLNKIFGTILTTTQMYLNNWSQKDYWTQKNGTHLSNH